MGTSESTKRPGVWRRGGPLREFVRGLRHRYGREAVKLTLGRLLRWELLADPVEGYSIVLGVPWDLRHLLGVNLRFLSRTDLADLREILVVFDRCERPGAEPFIEAARREHPDLPLTFLFYPARAGKIVERVNVSTFYNSMNTVTALARCTTRFAILHDFDLYPLVPDYFAAVHRALRDRGLRFSGLELTPFEGLSEDDNIIGTWCLGMDVCWLRENWRPIDCFHKVAKINGTRVNLDPYSYIQTQTPQRALAGDVDGTSCCHAKNLCSTYLRFVTGRPFKVAWRLHYVWYLESLSGMEHRLAEVTRAMTQASSSVLTIDGRPVDFSDTDPTCANVLRDEVARFEASLFGAIRPEVGRFLDGFGAFLSRFGSSEPHEAAA